MTLEKPARVMISRDIPEQTLTSDVAQLRGRLREGPDARRADGEDRQVRQRRGRTDGEQTARAPAGTGRALAPLDPAPRQRSDHGQGERRARNGRWPTTRPPTRTHCCRTSSTTRSRGLHVGDRRCVRPVWCVKSWATRRTRCAPNEMLDAGLPAPDYLPGGRSDLINPTSQGTGRVPTQTGIRRYQGLHPNRPASPPRCSRSRPARWARRPEARRGVTTGNEGIHQLFNDNRIKTVKDVVPASRLDELRIEGGNARQRPAWHPTTDR